MTIFITGCIFAAASFYTGYQWGLGVGKVRGNVEGRRAIRKVYEQVGK